MSNPILLVSPLVPVKNQQRLKKLGISKVLGTPRFKIAPESQEMVQIDFEKRGNIAQD